MEILSVITEYSDAITAVVNIILVFFVLTQIRDSRKPLLITKVSGKEDIKDPPDVLETGTLRLTISNISRNFARDIEILYCFSFDGRSVKITETKLGYLNPNEATRIVLNYGEIRQKYPELFEKRRNDGTIIRDAKKDDGESGRWVPKETLKIDTKITIAYNPVFWDFFPYKLEDTYFIEWGSLTSYPRMNSEDHPMSWNKRNGEFYIYKISDPQKFAESQS